MIDTRPVSNLYASASMGEKVEVSVLAGIFEVVNIVIQHFP